MGWQGMVSLINTKTVVSFEKHAYDIELDIYKRYNMSKEAIKTLMNMKKEDKEMIFKG